MPFFIPFLIKGAIVAGKAIIASHKANTVLHVVATAVKANGVAATVTTAATTCVVIGGIAWTHERSEDLLDCYQTYKRGDRQQALTKIASLMGKIGSVTANSFAESAKSILISKGNDLKDVVAFTKEVLGLADDINKEIRKPGLEF